MINNRLYHIEEVALIIRAYIFTKKGVKIIVEIPQDNTPQMELFLKAANVAMAFHGIK